MKSNQLIKTPMNKFEAFLGRIVPKIGPRGAFDVGRDSKIEAITKLLIKKGICSRQEVKEALDRKLEEFALKIENMPPLPTTQKATR